MGSFAGLLPPIAALVGIIYYLLQIYETKTVQLWLRYNRRHARHKRLQKEAAGRLIRSEAVIARDLKESQRNDR